MNIYVASSWRNPWQPGVVALLRALGHEVYDFRNPEPGDHGFGWKQVDPGLTAEPSGARLRRSLAHPIAERGFGLDFGAMKRADACVLVVPCGNSAHLELGWCAAAGKRTAVLYPHGIEPVPVGGHTVSNAACAPCGDIDGCHLPGRLHRVEPELMIKVADAILVNADELRAWLDAPRAEVG